MKLMLFTAFAFALVGCVTQSNVRENEPEFAGRSTKPASDVSACIGTAWSDFPGLSLSMIPSSERTIISLSGLYGTEAVAEVFPDGRVEVRRRNTPVKRGFKPLLRAVERCI